jgi:predicted metal-dependent hydrolase
MNELIQIDNLAFTLRRSARRRTIGIIVDRNGDLILQAPANCSTAEIERVTRETLLWTYTKLAEKKHLGGPPRPKKFINGEGFYYLGKSYRLLLVDTSELRPTDPPLQLKNGWFLFRSDLRSQAEEHFVNWYTEHAGKWLSSRIDRFATRMDVKPNRVEVRSLGYRWGSCSINGKLYFHWRTIMLPCEIIEYIIVHELAHLRERKHNVEFWRIIERVIPDYLERKKWLADNGGRL